MREVHAADRLRAAHCYHARAVTMHAHCRPRKSCRASVPRTSASAASTWTVGSQAAPLNRHAVLVVDGQVVPDAPASPQELLAQQRAWSYTTARVVGGHSVIDWELHVARLLRNMQLLAAQQPPAYAAWSAATVAAATAQQGDINDVTDASADASADESADESAALRQLLEPHVAQALALLAAAQHADLQQQQQQQDAMLVVVLTDPQPQRAPPPSLHNSNNKAAAAQVSEAGGAPPTHQRSSAQPRSLTVMVWASRAPPPPHHPACALLAPPGARTLAHAKHCEWVVARRPLEALKAAAGADEVLLVDEEDGSILEGLASNWFVVADADVLLGCAAEQQQGAAAAAAAAVPRRGQQVLLTTGMAHAALPGITQQRVLQAASMLGLPVAEVPAQLANAAAWREAFITNCLRGITPVTRVVAADGAQAWSAPPGAGRVTAALEATMAELQTATRLDC